MSALDLDKARGLAASVRQAVAGSPWVPLARRGAGYLIGLGLLALVGSGRLSRWLAPPPALGIAVAEAATALPAREAASTLKPPVPPPATAGVDEPAATSVPDPGADVAAGKGDGGAPGPDPGAASRGVAPDGKVILNLATEEDLRRLPGVGHGRAQAILALRERLKKFTRVEDLLKVKGIGRRGLARLRPLVRID
jgi:competence protein ComEA